MILVTLGTQDKAFPRLIKMVEDAIKLNNRNEEVVVQAGYTKYQSDTMKIFDYINMSEFDDLLTKCDVLITHGGVGTIVSALKQNKMVIAVPRLAEFGEHHNDHQCQIIDSFVEKGYILTCTNFEELAQHLNRANEFVPNRFESNHENFVELIRSEIFN